MTEAEYKIKYKDKYKTLLAFVNDSEIREELVKFRNSWETLSFFKLLMRL